jgi:Cytochrome P460
MAPTGRISAAVALVLAFLATSPAARAGDERPVSLPTSFRSWVHVRSMVVTDADAGMLGFHDVYANELALETLRSKVKGAAYPDGAQFVVSIFEVKQEKGTIVAGPKLRDVVQRKDRKAVATGGWRYGSFDAAGKPIAKDAASCHACHSQASDRDHVFTEFAQ